VAVTASVQEYLRRAGVAYTVFPHRRAYSAAQEAVVSHISGREWAKVVVCFADGRPIQAVVPANSHVDLGRLGLLLQSEAVRLAREDELAWLFPDCEVGAMPPFGPLYHQAVYIDASLVGVENIVFNAGTHGDAVAVCYADFERLARPVVGRFATVAV